MKLISIDNYEITISEEALLIGPIRRLWKQDRSKNKESFYKLMSVMFFVYSPASNYYFIRDEKERLREVLDQEGITDFVATQEFKDAVEAFKKANQSPELRMLESSYAFLEKSRQTLDALDYDEADDIKDKMKVMKDGMAIMQLIPKLLTDVKTARESISKELQEQGKSRGSQELSVGDLGLM